MVAQNQLLFASAETELTISTPYFVPDATLLEAFSAAAHRGVAVTLIYPKVNDSWIVPAASRSFDLNYENNILLRDEAITMAIHERQQIYISRSEQVVLATVLAWPYYRRIWNNVIATIGPVL